MLIIIWHLLADPSATYQDLGSDYYSGRIGHQRVLRRHVRELESLGYHVTLTPAA